jgi:hypothetical protein
VDDNLAESVRSLDYHGIGIRVYRALIPTHFFEARIYDRGKTFCINRYSCSGFHRLDRYALANDSKPLARTEKPLPVDLAMMNL